MRIPVVNRLTGLGLLVLVACGPKVSALFHDPSFTEPAMREGRLAILGAVAVPRIDDSDFLSNGFATRLLHREALDRRANLPLLPEGDVATAVDIGVLGNTLDSYRTRGSLRPDELAALRPIGELARYGILVRIDTNAVELKRDDLREIQDERVRSVTEFDSIRRVAATFDVYDLRQGGLVWTAYLSVKRDHNRRVDHGERHLDDERDAGITFTDQRDAPDAPELADLLGDLFRNFAVQLPGD